MKKLKTYSTRSASTTRFFLILFKKVFEYFNERDVFIKDKKTFVSNECVDRDVVFFFSKDGFKINGVSVSGVVCLVFSVEMTIPEAKRSHFVAISCLIQ